MVKVPLFVNIIIRRDAIDRAGKINSQEIINNRNLWGIEDDAFDDDLVVFRAGMGGDELEIMRRLEDKLGVEILRKSEDDKNWMCIDGVIVGHLDGPFSLAHGLWTVPLDTNINVGCEKTYCIHLNFTAR